MKAGFSIEVLIRPLDGSYIGVFNVDPNLTFRLPWDTDDEHEGESREQVKDLFRSTIREFMRENSITEQPVVWHLQVSAAELGDNGISNQSPIIGVATLQESGLLPGSVEFSPRNRYCFLQEELIPASE